MIDLEQVASATSKIGKFDSAESLLKAYINLEAEFTKRCQKLRELEGQLDIIASKNIVLEAETPSIDEFATLEKVKLLLKDEDFVDEFVLSDEAIINKVITDYLTRLCKNKVVKTLSTNLGDSVASPRLRAKSLDEAKKIIDKKL